jgi:hypothetical protein
MTAQATPSKAAGPQHHLGPATGTRLGVLVARHLVWNLHRLLRCRGDL